MMTNQLNAIRLELIAVVETKEQRLSFAVNPLF